MVIDIIFIWSLLFLISIFIATFRNDYLEIWDETYFFVASSNGIIDFILSFVIIFIFAPFLIPESIRQLYNQSKDGND